MESLNPHLTPLTTLASQVEAFAAQCLPDFIYKESETRDLKFAETDLSSYLGGRPDEVSTIRMKEGDETHRYAFTRWSRSQLLSLLGTREKWFTTVTRVQEVDELNKRAHALRNFMFRTMKSYDADELRLVRGIVSRQYSDIPDLVIMKALMEILPEGRVIKRFSGKTDRAFYATAITGEKISIPNTTFEGYPGVALRNSEVGYASLTLTPMVFLPHYSGQGTILVLKKKCTLRRVHRGEVKDLPEKFKDALDKAKVLWGPLNEKLGRLGQITYLTEDEAVGKMESMLDGVRADRVFVDGAARSYRGAQHAVHNALHVFEAILANVAGDDQDASYTNAELAGAVLLNLIE